MNSNTVQIILSAITAFFIAAGGAIIVVSGSGYAITDTVRELALVIGLVSAAKDTRSMLHLPPANEDQIKELVSRHIEEINKTKP